MAVGVDEAGVNPQSGGVDDLLTVGRGDAGADRSQSAVLNGKVTLVGNGGNSIVDQRVLNEHAWFLLV